MAIARRVGLSAMLAWVSASTVFVLLYSLTVPVPARADGDPASDVLLGQDVFLPYTPISPKIEDELYSVTSAAQRAGYPVKIALIGGKDDLGAVPQEFGHPESYAHFLSYEISTAVRGVVLVVMPNGFGLASGGRPRSVAALGRIPIGQGTNGLGMAAVAATERLATAAGHPLGSGATSATVSLGASAVTVRHALETLLVLSAIAALAVSAAVLARSRRRSTV
jgi:hypothetical protein